MIAKILEGRRDGKVNIQQAVNYAMGISKHREQSILHVGRQILAFTESIAIEMESLTFPATERMRKLATASSMEMAGLASENERCKNPLLNFILSWKEDEIPTQEQIDKAAKIALKELDLQDCQAIWALHSDTNNLHLHVIANKIHPETGKAVQPNGRWTKRGLERAARKIEYTFGLSVEPNSCFEIKENGEVVEKPRFASQTPTLPQKIQTMEAHTGYQSIITIVKEQAAEIIKTAQSWDELHKRLAERNIKFELSSHGNGAVLNFQGKYVKLSAVVDKENRLPKLEARLGCFQLKRYRGRYHGGKSQEFEKLLPKQRGSKAVDESVDRQQNQENADSPEKGLDIKTILSGPAGTILKNAKDWKTLHEQLAKLGIRLRVRRKSVTLSVLDVDTNKEVHVAFPSTISRELFLSSLEKRLGAFQKFSTREFREHLPEQKRSKAKVQATNSAETERNNTASNTSQAVTPELRICVKQILKTSKTWAELHVRLAGQNVTFEVKGGGAILDIQGTQIKASSLDRVFSLSKFETRLGKFQPHSSEEKAPPTPIKRIKKFKDVNTAWEEYTRQKEESKYHWETAWRDLQDKQFDEREDLKTAQKAEREVLSKGRESWKKRKTELGRGRTDLTAKQDAERQKLKEKHRLEREELKKSWFRPSPFQWQSLWDKQAREWDILQATQKTERDVFGKDREGWKNHGAELNRERSILAGKQAAEKLELKERQKREREKLKKSRRFFPSFKVWLEMQEDEELARKYRYGTETPIFTSGNNGKEQSSKRVICDIRDYHAKTFAGRVLWCCSDTPEKADFIDHGRRIVMAESYDESAVLAAMQLSAQKWGKIKVDGTDENFRQLCVKLAAEHNFRLANEDLAKQVEEKKQEIANQHAEEWLRKTRLRHSSNEVYNDDRHKAKQQAQHEASQKVVDPKKGDFVEFKFSKEELMIIRGKLVEKSDKNATIRFQTGPLRGKTTTVYLDKGTLHKIEREQESEVSNKPSFQNRSKSQSKGKYNSLGY